MTPLVAEFFNTISSFAMAIVGILGCLLHPWAEYRFHLSFLTLAIVGFGSAAFHATLLKTCQAMDEVPMLYCTVASLYIVACHRYNLTPTQRTTLQYGLVLYAILATLLVTLSEGPNQVLLFHLSYSTVTIFVIVQTVLMYLQRRSSVQAAHGARSRPRDPALQLFEYGISVYLIAFTAWLIDLFLCEYVNPHYESAILPFNPHLHAWWHILVSAGCYCLSLFALVERLKVIDSNLKISVAFWYGIVPFVLRGSHS
eukprot:jgi/Hompol1/3424/HPOL_003235-RA